MKIANNTLIGILKWIRDEKAAYFWAKVIGTVVGALMTIITLFYYYVDLKDQVNKLESRVAIQNARLNYITYKDLRKHYMFLWIEDELKKEYKGKKAKEWKNYLIDNQRFYISKIDIAEYDEKHIIKEPEILFLPESTYIFSIKEKVEYLKRYDMDKLAWVDVKIALYYDLSFSLYALNLYKNELTRTGGLYESID
jgi:hypothetical protein